MRRQGQQLKAVNRLGGPASRPSRCQMQTFAAAARDSQLSTQAQEAAADLTKEGPAAPVNALMGASSSLMLPLLMALPAVAE